MTTPDVESTASLLVTLRRAALLLIFGVLLFTTVTSHEMTQLKLKQCDAADAAVLKLASAERVAVEQRRPGGPSVCRSPEAVHVTSERSKTFHPETTQIPFPELMQKITINEAQSSPACHKELRSYILTECLFVIVTLLSGVFAAALMCV